MKIELETSEEYAAELNKLMVLIGAKTYKDLFNNALSILGWAANETKSGNNIAAINEGKQTFRELWMPCLKYINNDEIKEVL